MIALLIIGIIVIIAGVLLIVAPNALNHMNTYLSKQIFSDSAISGHRIIMAILCLAVGALLLYLYFSYL